MRYVREFLFHRLILFLVLLGVVSGVTLSLAPRHTWSSLAFLAGITVVILVEYFVHRFILHEFPTFIPAMYRGHQLHHEHPNDADHLFGPVRYDLVSYVILWSLIWTVSGSLQLSASFVFGAVLCQLFYQWKHYISHRPIVPITPWGKWMKKKHLLHHHLDDHAWYGVSNPVLDVLLGTDTPDASKRSVKPASPDHNDLPM